MEILPAIDLIDKKAVRLKKGDYNQMTVFDNDPTNVALDFLRQGAKMIHMVDLDGAKTGEMKNGDVVKKVIEETGLKVEIGGGIRSFLTIEKYLSLGVCRVILGTKAVGDEEFLKGAVKSYGEKIAVGVDVLDGVIKTDGWLKSSGVTLFDFLKKLSKLGVKTVICTDISKDGMQSGTNLEMYKTITDEFDIDFVASGGVGSLSDIDALKSMGISGAIIGKAYYEKTIDLAEAIRRAR